MAVTNLIAAVAVAALAIYLWTHAASLAEDEAEAFHRGSQRMAGVRRLSHRIGAVFLVAVAVGLIIAGIS